jgi:hypothetical protein
MLGTFLIISLSLSILVSYCIFTSCIHKRFNNNNNNTFYNNNNNNNTSVAIPIQNIPNNTCVAIPIQNIPNNEIVTVRSVVI